MVQYRLIATTVALLVALAGCGSVERRQEVTVPLRVIEQPEQTIAFVPVSISGQGPFLFALDTGASSTVVSRDVARALGLPATGEQRRITGVVGAETEPVVRVDDWSMGQVQLQPLDVVAINLPSPDGTGLQGLLGSDVLSRFGQVVIDYDAQQLRIPRG